MGVRKLNLGLETNKRSRYIPFQNRKMGLIKKAKELSILCDIDVCLIIYAPNNDGQPEIWPRDPNKVRRMVNMYYGRSREPRRKRATNSSALFEARKNKIDGEIVNLRGVNAEPKDSTWDYRLNSLSYNGLKDLSSTLEKKIEQVELMAASSKSNQCLMESANTLVLMETSHQLSQYNSSCMGKHTMFQEAQSSPWTLTGSTNPQSHLCSQKVYREVSECLWPVIDMSPLASMPLFSPERMSSTQMMVGDEDYSQCYGASSSNSYQLNSMIDYFIDCNQAGAQPHNPSCPICYRST